MRTLEQIWDEILDQDIATKAELQLITQINGYSIESLNDVIYARTGCRSMEQLNDEEEGEY